MGAASLMQTYDAYKAVAAGKYASGLIALGIALVQLPDVMGWLFGEIMKIGWVITAVDFLNEKFTILQHSVEIKCEKMVHEMMAIIISIRNAIRGTNEKYEPLVEEKEEEKKEVVEESDDEDDEDPDDVEIDIDGAQKAGKPPLVAALEQLNEMGRQVTHATVVTLEQLNEMGRQVTHATVVTLEQLSEMGR